MFADGTSRVLLRCKTIGTRRVAAPRWAPFLPLPGRRKFNPTNYVSGRPKGLIQAVAHRACGTMPAPAAIIAAIEDALSPFGVHFAEMPLTPDRIVAALRAAGRL